MDTQKTSNTAKLRGFAIKALKAFVKALEMKDGEQKSTGRYRYEIPENGTTARIYVTETGETVPGFERTLDEWAADGKRIRLAFIGLLDAKIALDDQARQAREGGYARYTLNAITGEAYVSRNGARISELPDTQKQLLAREQGNAQAAPETIDGWALIGRPVEKYYFEGLKAAQDYGSENGVAEYREKMIARGIIRDPQRDKRSAQ